MLEQIDKILKSNWSSSWFQKSDQISPKFRNEQPTNNLNNISDQVLKILLNNSNNMVHDSRFEGGRVNERRNDESLAKRSSLLSLAMPTNGRTVVNLSALNRNKLHSILVDKSNMSEPDFERLVRSNVSIDNDELRVYLIDEIGADGLRNEAALNPKLRQKLMSKMFCDPQRFNKIIRIETQTGSKHILICFLQQQKKRLKLVKLRKFSKFPFVLGKKISV